MILLGCRLGAHGALSPTAERRAQRALVAFRAGLSGHVLACGGKAWSGVREADALCAFLAKSGLPDAALEGEIWSRSTRQNAHHAARLLLPRGFRRVGIVTCDWHMPRALSCFRGAGFDAEPLPAESPPVNGASALARAVRERFSIALDHARTLGFSRV